MATVRVSHCGQFASHLKVGHLLLEQDLMVSKSLNGLTTPADVVRAHPAYAHSPRGELPASLLVGDMVRLKLCDSVFHCEQHRLSRGMKSNSQKT